MADVNTQNCPICNQSIGTVDPEAPTEVSPIEVGTVIDEPVTRLDPAMESGGDETVNTEDVSVNTQLVCPKCKGRNYLRDGECVKCDKGWV